MFPDSRPLGKQLKYADRKGFRLVIIAGVDEFSAGNWQLKDLASGQQHEVSNNDLVETLAEKLAETSR